MAASDSGIGAVTTSSSSSERVTLSIAAPDSTGCVQYATTLVAPSALSAAAAAHRVPAGSTMSSTSTQIFPRTSPMMYVTRSEESRVGKECVCTGRSRGSPVNSQKQTNIKTYEANQ